MIKGIFVVAIEDTGMDSGCFHDILTECAEHGRVLAARCTGTAQGEEGITETYDNDVLFFMDTIEQGPIVGKC